MNKNKSKRILHIAHHKIVDISQMQQLLDHQYGVQRRLGALPLSIIKNLKKEDIKELTEKADKIFQNFSKKVSQIEIINKKTLLLNSIHFKSKIDSFNTELKELFQQQNIQVEYIGSGSFKHCFSIKFDDEYKYTIQTFHNFAALRCDWTRHGMIYEPQNYFMVYHNYSRGRIAKPFMSYTTTSEICSGAYILTKHISNDYPRKSNRGEFVFSRDKVISFDLNNPQNIKQGVIIDTGGFAYNQNYIKDPRTRNKRHEFAQILDNFDLHAYRNRKLFDMLFIKYKKMGDEFFDTTKWPEMIATLPNKCKEDAPRILRLLLHLKNKRKKMEHDDNYEQIKKLLEQDFINIFDGNPKYDVFLRPEFYPEIICEILGINTPELQKLNPNQPSCLQIFFNKLKEKIR